MKKLFSLIALLCLCGSGAWAAGYTRTLSDKLSVPTYQLKAFYDFQKNDPAVLPTTGNNTKDMFYREGGIWGLHNFGSGTRTATATIPVEAGDLLVLQDYAGNATINVGSKNEELSTSTGYLCFDITETAASINITAPRYGGVVAALVMEKSEMGLTVKYKSGNTVVKSEELSTDGLVIGESYSVPYRMYVEKDGHLYTAAKQSSGAYYGKNITVAKNNIVEIPVTEVSLYGGTLELLEDLDNTNGQNAGVRASNCSAYDNKSYTSANELSAGIYKFIIRAQGKNRGSSIKAGDITVFEASSIGNGTWSDAEIYVTIPEAAKLSLVAGSGKTIDDYDIIIAIKLADYRDCEIIGETNCSTGYMQAKKGMTISQGEKVKYTFYNHGKATQSWYNWLLQMNGTGIDLTLRADNYVVGDGTSELTTHNITIDEGSINWVTFKNEMQNAYVDMTIDYSKEGVLSVNATAQGANHTYTHTFTHNAALSGDINLGLGVEFAWLEVLSAEKIIPTTMSAAGYTTFSSTSNIDADAIVGGKAYVINAFNAENVVLTPATGIVPANTGMIIAGEGGAAASAGTVTIPVSTADATFDTSNNLLVACATATTVQAAAAGKKNYVLAYDAADAANTIGFYYIGSTSATVAAGKAYLTVDEATPAKMFRFTTGNTTGIKAVSNEMTANKAVKRIMNGQLVIEKAGKMYNAAGAQMK